MRTVNRNESMYRASHCTEQGEIVRVRYQVGTSVSFGPASLVYIGLVSLAGVHLVRMFAIIAAAMPRQRSARLRFVHAVRLDLAPPISFSPI